MNFIPDMLQSRKMPDYIKKGCKKTSQPKIILVSFSIQKTSLNLIGLSSQKATSETFNSRLHEKNLMMMQNKYSSMKVHKLEPSLVGKSNNPYFLNIPDVNQKVLHLKEKMISKSLTLA